MLATFARIYPLYLITLLFLIIFFYLTGLPWGAPYNTVHAIWTNLLLIQSLHVQKNLTWNIPAWSISTEWYTYVIFPFLLFLFLGRKTIRLLLYILVILTGYWFLTNRLTQTQTLDTTFDFGYLRCVLGFFTGVILYALYDRMKESSRFRGNGWFLTAGILTFLLLYTGVSDLLIVGAMACMVFAASLNASRLSQVLSWKPLQVLGDISYSIYLWQIGLFSIILLVIRGQHIPYQGMFHTDALHIGILGKWIVSISFNFILILISLASYRWLEKPARDYLNRKWIHHQAVTPSLAEPAPGVI
ncbi:MAG TPA: acyltransferase [Chitinophagaceae bacterium]|nr:acyltransferase [Chitinophagaceae bacterium]